MTDHRLKPLSSLGTGVTRTPQTTMLAQLVARLNDLFEGDLSDADLVAYVQHIAGKMLENETLAQQAAQNNKQQFGLGDFHRVLTDTVIEGLGRYESMASQVMGNDALKQEFAKLLLDVVYEGFKARAANGGDAPSSAGS
jgi:type I restriction enzyme R subunit